MKGWREEMFRRVSGVNPALGSITQPTHTDTQVASLFSKLKSINRQTDNMSSHFTLLL